MKTSKQLQSEYRKIKKQADQDLRDLNSGRKPLSLGDLIRAVNPCAGIVAEIADIWTK